MEYLFILLFILVVTVLLYFSVRECNPIVILEMPDQSIPIEVEFKVKGTFHLIERNHESYILIPYKKFGLEHRGSVLCKQDIDIEKFTVRYYPTKGKSKLNDLFAN